MPVTFDNWMNMRKASDEIQRLMVEQYDEWRKDLSRPRQGPRRRRVFVEYDKPRVSDAELPWAELVADAYGNSDERTWDDLPDDMLAAFGYWDWEYLPPIRAIFPKE